MEGMAGGKGGGGGGGGVLLFLCGEKWKEKAITILSPSLRS